jgi:FAST kinase-like protein, subdomain 1
MNSTRKLWAFATLNHEAPSLFEAIATAAKERMDDFNPQGLANTAWAFATLKHEAPSLLEAVAIAAEEFIALTISTHKTLRTLLGHLQR